MDRRMMRRAWPSVRSSWFGDPFQLAVPPVWQPCTKTGGAPARLAAGGQPTVKQDRWESLTALRVAGSGPAR